MIQNNRIYSGAVAVTPGDATEVGFMGLYVGGTGSVAVKDALGNTTTFVAVPAGTSIPLNIVRVLSTGTTATNLVGFLA